MGERRGKNEKPGDAKAQTPREAAKDKGAKVASEVAKGAPDETTDRTGRHR